MAKYTQDENQILDDIENGKYKTISNIPDELTMLKSAAKNTTAKTKNINIRVSQADIAKLKAKSIEVGIPYQTIVNALIHNYATNKIQLTI